MASSARIDELRKKFDENPRRYFAPLANEYRKAGDVQRAIELCREHLPQQPGHMSGHIVYGQALFEARDFDEARRVFEAALALDPENLIALRHLGDIARDHGDVAAARDWYQRVLDADPRNEEIATQIASLNDVAAGGGAAPEMPALLDDISADVAAGMVDLPVGAAPAAAEARRDAAPPSATPARAESASHDFLDDALLGGALAGDAAVGGHARAPEEASDALDFDAMESPRAGAASERPLGLEPTSDEGAEPGMIDLPTAEMAAPSRSEPREANDSNFGEIDLEASGSGRGSSSLELDEAMDTGLSPTPPSGSAPIADRADARPRDEDDSLLDLGEMETGSPSAPVASATPAPEAARDQPAATAAASDEGYSLGRLAGLESMEFVAPGAADAPAAHDPTLGHTLRDDVTAPAATPAAFVTETMAELYLQQGFRDEALAVYRQLLLQSPDDASLRERVAQLESGSVSTLSAATVSSSVIEAAQQRSATRHARTVRSFFASLAARRAPQARHADDAATPGEEEGAPSVESLSSAEERAADEYVEATGEGVGGSSDVDDAPSVGASSGRGGVGEPPSAFDEFGFPVVENDAEGAPSQETATGAAREAATQAEGADLPESAAIEPATLDYLAHEGGVDEESDSAPRAADETAASDASGRASSPGEGGVNGPVDSLFDGASVSSQDEEAAAALADAFGAPAPQPVRAPTGEARRVDAPASNGTPAPGVPSRDASRTRDARTPATRPAARELSLDDVFRETPRRSGSVKREAAGSFSFDQFFADGSTPSAGKGSSARADASPAGGASGASPEEAGGDPTTADIEQFNAWLEGLKKK